MSIEIEDLARKCHMRLGYPEKLILADDAEIIITKLAAEVARLTKALEIVEKDRIGYGHYGAGSPTRLSQIASQALRLRTLDAKWLDPVCYEGCQSLVLKQEVEKLREANKALNDTINTIQDQVRNWAEKRRLIMPSVAFDNLISAIQP